MALDSGYWETGEKAMDNDDVATLLVKLYADYKRYYGCNNDDYAKAVGIAIRLLHDYD